MPIDSRKRRIDNMNAGTQAQTRNGVSVFGELSLLSARGISEVVTEDIKAQMLCDPKIYQGLTLFKAAVLADDMEIITAVDQGDPRYKKAKRIRDFCQTLVMGMDGSAYQKNWQFLDSAWDRNKVANIVGQEQTSGTFKGKWTLKRLQVFRKGTYSFVLDPYENTLGVVLAGSRTFKPEDRLWPRRKLAIATFRPDSDLPIGTTLAEPAYFSYYLKQRGAEERLKNLAQFGSPSLKSKMDAGEGMPEKVAKVDATGEPILGADGQPEQEIEAFSRRRNLEGFGNGAIAVLSPGEDLDILQAQSSGNLFHEYEVDANDAIISVFLGTTLMTEKAHQSLGASATGSGTFGWTVRDGKSLLEELWYEDIFKPFVEMNFGADAVELTPAVSFGSNMSMMASILNSLSAMASVGMIDNELWDFFKRRFGWPTSSADAKPINNGVLTGNVKAMDKEDKPQPAKESE